MQTLRKVRRAIVGGALLALVGCGPAAAPEVPDQTRENEQKVKDDLQKAQQQEGKHPTPGEGPIN